MPLTRNTLTVLSLAALVLLAGCQTFPKHQVHHRVVEQPGNPLLDGKAILLPLDVEVKELSVGGVVEVVPAWTETAKTNLRDAFYRKRAETFAGMEIIDMPELDDAEARVVSEHIALNAAVVGSALQFGFSREAAWAHKRERFDYSIGPGLAFLAEQTGADKAIVLQGDDVHSSSGRVATFILFAALGVAIPMGDSFTVANVIDLRTGDVMWMNYQIGAGSVGYLRPDDADLIMSGLFTDYPGLEVHRERIANKN